MTAAPASATTPTTPASTGDLWSVVPTPSPYPADNVLSGVSCVSASFCLAVGGGSLPPRSGGRRGPLRLVRRNLGRYLMGTGRRPRWFCPVRVVRDANVLYGCRVHLVGRQRWRALRRHLGRFWLAELAGGRPAAGPKWDGMVGRSVVPIEHQLRGGGVVPSERHPGRQGTDGALGRRELGYRPRGRP